MSANVRYEIVDTIATGDFATVYRARDRELGREVAIKQIHPHFLRDERQLARFWQEAQLLATLQHPNIITIYDVVRDRGWLILELMRGNLQQVARGQPLELRLLRQALMAALNALHFLHRHGVIHGDVKPTNLLVDAQGRVKLGDFGLARRASNEEGSLLKGTTKYMAPEVVSDQFGAVGPASDLYSLGFTAYELLCGARFEDLFPGLATFGRDRQIAWMLWHAAADRALPPIERVLEGVPDDLRHVIQRMVVKDQAKRYRTASEVLQDLRRGGGSPGTDSSEEDAAALEAEAAAVRKKRHIILGGTLSVVVVAAVLIGLWLAGAFFRHPPPPPAAPQQMRGKVGQVYREEKRLEIILADSGKPEEIFIATNDRIFLNDKLTSLRYLLPDDRVEVRQVIDPTLGRIKEIHASRPVEEQGRIVKVTPDEGTLTIEVGSGEAAAKKLVVAVPANIEIVFNGQAVRGGQQVKLADLRPEDRVVVHHIGEERGRQATALRVERDETIEGIIREVIANKNKNELTIAVGEGQKAELITRPVAPDCEVTLNLSRFHGERRLRLDDLRPGDRVKVEHDSRIKSVAAFRVVSREGVILTIEYARRAFDIMPEGSNKPITYVVSRDCQILLGGEPVTLDDLRSGDRVELTHGDPANANPPVAARIAAVRPSDPSRWAIVIGNQNYDDARLTPLRHPRGDAELLHRMLVKRFRVPPDQALLLVDETRVRLEQAISERLARIPAEATLIVYFGGHAYRDEEGQVHLAAKDFAFQRMATGLPLQWLVAEMDNNCPAREKLLLLDCAHSGQGTDLAQQPATAEMIRSLRGPPGRGPLRTITAIVSCRAGQRGLVVTDEDNTPRSLFARCLAEGFAGRADKNLDNRLELTELYSYLEEQISQASRRQSAEQAPELILPDARPPRLTEDAKREIRALAALLRQDRLEWYAVEQQYQAAKRESGKELEPAILYALLLLKYRGRDESAKRTEAVQKLEELRLARPNLLFTWQGIVWMRLERRTYRPAADAILALVSQVPKPAKAEEELPEEMRRLLAWAGQAREYLASGVEEPHRLSAELLAPIDAAVAAMGSSALQSYQEGRARTKAKLAEFDRRIAAATDEAAAMKLKIDRRRLTEYIQFPFEEITQAVLAGLEEQ
jgi:serine/threonine-protein kinase